MTELAFDISKHSVVPKHELVNDAEKAELMKKYGITLKQLPRVLDNDPMVKLLAAKPGDLIRITRKSQTAGTATYYRVVIKG